MNIQEIELKLKEPFFPNEIEWRISAKSKDNTKGLAVAYISNRAVQNRLDDVLGFTNWKNEFVITPDGSKICGLSLRINDEWITKYDGASDTDIEATKGGLSNSMKRAAVQWGVGRYLYNLEGVWVKIKQQGRSYVIDEKPVLPSWALPKNYKKPQIKKEWEQETVLKEIKKPVADCIKAFSYIGISQADLENYLHLDADMFTDNDLDTLRTIYIQITKNNKPKEDYFLQEEPKRCEKTLKLEAVLKGDRNRT